MPIVTIDYALKEIADNRLLFWSIKDGRALLAEQDDSAMTLNNSISLLREKLLSIGNGLVTVNASPKPKKERRGADTFKIRTFSLNLDKVEKAVSGAQPVSSGADYNQSPKIESLHHQLLEKEREILKLSYALERAEDERDQWRKKYDDLLAEESEEETIGGFSPKMIESVLTNSLAALFTPATPAPPAPINGLPEDLTTWQQLDADAPKVVAAILKVIAREPQTYQTIKSVLFTNFK